MQKLLAVLACFLTVINSPLYSQSKVVGLGEKVPDIVLPFIHNGPVSSARLSDFKGKLVILDLWATSCSSCIKGFPKMQALQEKYKDKIVILPVNIQADGLEVIPSFWQSNPITKNLTLPTVIDAKRTIREYFPSKGVPHAVWIDEEGILRYTGLTDVVNETEIERMLAGNKTALPYRPNRIAYSPTKPLITENPVEYHGPLGITKVGAHRVELESHLDSSFNTQTGRKRLYFVNRNILSVIHYAINLRGYPLHTFFRRQFALKDSSLFYYKEDLGYRTEWENNMSICYEMEIDPKASAAEISDRIIQDINTRFNLHVQVKQFKETIWEIRQARSPSPGFAARFSTDAELTEPIRELVSILKLSKNMPVVLLEDQRLLNIALSYDRAIMRQNIKEPGLMKEWLKQTLHTAGLELVEKTAEIDILYIAERTID